MAKDKEETPVVTTWIAPAHDHSAPAEVVEAPAEVPASE